MELNLKFDEQLLIKVCNKILDEYEYNGKTIREWADRISNPKTNADQIRNMTDEELADWLVMNGDGSDYQTWLEWLREEYKSES